jgi:hypothetical protein
MKLEECCGATNVRRTNVLCTNAGGECCGATNALWANLFEECFANVCDDFEVPIFNSTPNALEYRVGDRSREGNRVRHRR